MHPSEIGMRHRAAKPHHPHPSRSKTSRNRHDSSIFQTVNAAASGQIGSLAQRWLTTTRMSGENLIALNPTRADKHLGSFSINVRTGKWADFATQDAGGDIISFYAYLHGLDQLEAAKALADILGVRT